MLVIYPFHAADQDRALQTANWIHQLGTVEKHQLLLVHDRFTDPETGKEIETTLKGAFRHVVRMPLREGAPGVKGMNLLFRRAVRQVAASEAGPFLWMNPDSIPLREGWLDAIEVAYRMLPKGKKFLGCYQTDSVPRMAAVGVYPQDCEVHAPNLVMADANPFHFNAAPQVVPKMAHTDLIVDSFNPAIGNFPDSAVLWHGSDDCKDGSLIEDLEALLPAGFLTPLPIVEPKQEPEKTGAEKFAVPESPITRDNASRQAISKAGSEGIPSDEVDTGTQVSGIKPPTVTPIRATPDPRQSPAEIKGLGHKIWPDVKVNHHQAQPPRPLQPMPKPIHPEIARGIVEQADEGERALSPQKEKLGIALGEAGPAALVKLLAAARDHSPADKAAVLAALREAGFPISGKKAKGARK
jgi:hypothetical protein